MREIKIDFDNPGLPQRLDVVENDAQSRFFKAVLYKDGKAYAAPSGATYSIMYRDRTAGPSRPRPCQRRALRDRQQWLYASWLAH